MDKSMDSPDGSATEVGDALTVDGVNPTEKRGNRFDRRSTLKLGVAAGVGAAVLAEPSIRGFARTPAYASAGSAAGIVRNTAAEDEILRLINELRDKPTGMYARIKPPPACATHPSFGLSLDANGVPTDVPILEIDASVSTQMAYDWSVCMGADDDFRHRENEGDTTPDSQKEIYERIYPMRVGAFGENIAFTASTAYDGTEDGVAIGRMLFEQWRESDSGHYCNMLSPNYSHIGIGVAFDPSYVRGGNTFGAYFGTQNFFKLD